MRKPLLAAALIAFSGSLALSGAQAQTMKQTNDRLPASGTSQPQTAQQRAPDAKELVRDASRTVQEMKRDAKFANYMKQAKGIFIIPTLVKGSLIVGGEGGQGVLLAHKDGRW